LYKEALVRLPVAKRWFENRRIDDRITLIWEPHVDPLLRANIWHVEGESHDLLVDTGLGIQSLRAALEAVNRPIIAVATHGHYDHVGGMHEFDSRTIHPLDAPSLETPSLHAALLGSGFPTDLRKSLADAGYPLPELLIDAFPYEGFSPARYAVAPTTATDMVDEGDAIDLGDAHFQILHLPGHTAGSIGLWDPGSGVLFSGDAVYDGPLLDELPGSDIGQYVLTMKRLRELPVKLVHGGHDRSFGRARLLEIVDAYLARRELASDKLEGPPGPASA
jgi:glyoxylase-like metal-dependent hydrolase (beta-lactamase superfamily II)